LGSSCYHAFHVVAVYDDYVAAAVVVVVVVVVVGRIEQQGGYNLRFE
jgi:hypothetical protein